MTDQIDILPDLDCVWTVDSINAVRKRKIRNLRKQEAWRRSFCPTLFKPEVTYATEAEAWAFVVERARDRVRKAEKNLKNERAGLAKAEKRLAAAKRD